MKTYSRALFVSVCGVTAGWWVAASTILAQPPRPAAAPASNEIIRLDEFTVTGSQSASGYRATNTITATGIGAKIGRTPLAISVITDDLIKDTQLFEMREALNFVPGVLTNPRSDSAVTIRGFGGNVSYRNGQYRRQLMTTWNMDRIEVIKGPAAIFFGAVRPGGIVNNVTAKPVFSGTFTDIKATAGNEGFVRGEVFHNRKLSDRLAIRVGVGGLDVNGERTFEYRHEYYLGLSAIWRHTPAQQITFDVEGINRRVFYLSSYPVRSLANSKVIGVPGAIAAQAALNRQNTTADTANRNYLTALGYSGTVGAPNFYPLHDTFAPYGYGDTLSHDATQWQEGRAVDLDYLLKIGAQLVWQTTLNHAFDDTAGLQPSDGDTRPYADGTLRFRVEDFINIRHSYNAHNKLTWRFDAGPTKHTVQLAHEYQRVIFTRPGFLNAANQYVNSPGNTGAAAINPYITGFRPGVTAPASLRATIRASGQTFNVTRKHVENGAGYFIVDQARLFDDRVFLLGGIRYNKFTGKIAYDKPVSNSSLSAGSPGGLATRDAIGAKGAWTPQYGALVTLSPGLFAFATYSESLEPKFGLDAEGTALEPKESKSWDFGLKTEFLDGRVISTIACYDTKRENLSYRDTPREIATGRSPYYIFGNAEASRGLEIELNWSPTDQYQLVGGWSHVTAAETTKSNNATFAGRRFGGIPQNTYVLWNRYSFESAPVKGLTFGFGVRHHDDANLSPDPNNIVRIPSFTVWDAMAAYRFRAFKHDTRVQFNVKNLTDELHREGADGFFGQARTYYLSLSTRL